MSAGDRAFRSPQLIRRLVTGRREVGSVWRMTNFENGREPLDAWRLRALLGPRWGSVQVVDEVDSTNAALLAPAAARTPHRSLLVAEHQAAGRGRFDRVWSSPPRSGLTFSVLVRPSAPVATWGWLPLLAGVALTEAVPSGDGAAPVLKWPNDLLASPGGGKLAGILSQTSEGAVVIGIGLNVTTTREELPVDTASSLLLGGATELDRTTLLAAVASALDGWFTRWDDVGGDAGQCGLADAYRIRCATIGRSVRVSLGDGETVTGTATGVDDGGGLVVSTGSGTRTVVAGDVEHVREP